MMSVGAGQDLFSWRHGSASRAARDYSCPAAPLAPVGCRCWLIWPHRADRSELGMKVVVHCGLVSPELAAGLAASGADGVMLDIIGADEDPARRVPPEPDRRGRGRSLRLLSDRGLRIIPHIVLGLHYGRFLGEHRASRDDHRLLGLDSRACLLVPLAGTPMAHVPPPRADQWPTFSPRPVWPRRRRPSIWAVPVRSARQARARRGCDRTSVLTASPTRGRRHRVREVARAQPRLFEYCCSLTWQEAQEIGLAKVQVAR